MRWIGVMVLVAAVLAGCSSGFDKPVKEVTAAPDTDGVQRVRVVTHSFWFEPNRIVVHANHPVELTVKNHAWFVPHNLSCHDTTGMPELKMNVGMFKGSKMMTFTPTTVGEYDFFCGKKGHAGKGMLGKLVVVQ